jgi:signal recognition particle subunit SRP54
MNKMTAGVDMSGAERDLKRVEAMIQSMTPYERHNPKLIKASRKRRIAAGSGATVQEVNVLLKQHREMQEMMKQFQKGGRGGRNALSSLLGGRLPSDKIKME